MNSNDIKKAVTNSLMRECDHLLVLEEMPIRDLGFIADLYSLTAEGYGLEIEVKVSAEDLKKELKTIDYILYGEEKPKEMPYKFHKHFTYLQLGRKNTGVNFFYFAVPKYLKDLAMSGLVDTKYGLLYVDEKHEMFCVKTGELLTPLLPTIRLIGEYIKRRSLRILEMETSLTNTEV